MAVSFQTLPDSRLDAMKPVPIFSRKLEWMEDKQRERAWRQADGRRRELGDGHSPRKESQGALDMRTYVDGHIGWEKGPLSLTEQSWTPLH